MKRIPLFFLMLVLLLSITSSVSAAPNEVRMAAEKGLKSFIESEKGYASYWGLTEEQLGGLTIGEGYHMVMVAKVAGKDVPVEARLKAFGDDHYLFHVLDDGNTPVISLRVVKMQDGWEAVYWSQLGTDEQSSLDKAVGHLKAKGTVMEGTPRYVFFRGHGFWLVEGGGESYIFPELGEAASPGMQSIGITGKALSKAGEVLEALVNLPSSPDDGKGWGGGDIVQPRPVSTVVATASVAGGGLLLFGVAVLVLRRRMSV